MAFQEGFLLENRYRIVRPLSRGAMVMTYLAIDTLASNKQVAIEILRSNQPDAAVNLLHKARILMALNHPHILRIFDFGLEGDMAFFTTEYVPNGTLRQKHLGGEKVPLDAVISYTKQIADALQYVHDKGFIHRDVKPENILLGSNNSLILSDFGIATQMSNTDDAFIAGTPSYMAPEQWRGRAVPASDQYALGISVYEWLTGKRPFEGASQEELLIKHLSEPPPPLRPQVPIISPQVERTVLKALQKDTQERFPSVLAFANALEAANMSGVASVPMQGVSKLGTNTNTLPPTSLPSQQSGALPPVFSKVTPSSPPNPVTPGLPSSGPYSQTPTLSSPHSHYNTSTLPSTSSRQPLRSRLSSLLKGASGTLTNLFPYRGTSREQKKEISLFAIARTDIESDNCAITGKEYTVQAGISQKSVRNFLNMPFKISVQDPVAKLLFDILLHPDENVELKGTRFHRLHYDPRNIEPQLISCPFRVQTAGSGSITVNFYRERQWLKTIRIELTGIEQTALSTA